MDENRPLQYLEQYTSKATIKSYKASLRNFFESLYGERKPLEGLAKRYVDEERDHEKDVHRFFISMKGRAPKTVRRNLSAIRTFLMENGVELPQLFWRRLRSRIQGSRAQTIDAVPSNADLKQIMMYLPLHGRALYLTLLSSGMRIGEALQLRDDDADFDKVPVQVNIKGEYTKSGNPRVAFISDEAKEVLNEWLPRREEYLVVAAAKSRLHEKPVNDPRLFPFGDVNARHIWNTALAKSGHGERDGTTGIRKTHPHTLRKFFRSQLGTVIPVDVVEALMGHEGYLTEVYRKYSQKQLGQFYLKGEHVLHVFTGSTEVNEIRREVKERNEQLQSLV
ncbi:MAG: site-specific integrase, partial [Candidatus Bathyarchaeota archaeon]|nr:site-specific integrase [Candidatus Bathyarchaeota archaeon]